MRLDPDDVRPWAADVVLGRRLIAGPTLVQEVLLDGRPALAHRSDRSAASLAWELDLLDALRAAGFAVPAAVPTLAGRRHAGGVVVTEPVDGRPPVGDAEWRAVAAELCRLHRTTEGWPQRPGSCTARQLLTRHVADGIDLRSMPASAIGAVRAAWSRLPEGPTGVVHGDPTANNVRVLADGRVALAGWHTARVDVGWFDLVGLPVSCLPPSDCHVARRAGHAWEAAREWSAEPAYARWRLDLLASA